MRVSEVLTSFHKQSVSLAEAVIIQLGQKSRVQVWRKAAFIRVKGHEYNLAEAVVNQAWRKLSCKSCCKLRSILWNKSLCCCSDIPAFCWISNYFPPVTTIEFVTYVEFTTFLPFERSKVIVRG